MSKKRVTKSNRTADQGGRPSIPVIDLFAGPGGLSEGFSALHQQDGNPAFDVRLSIEKDATAHRTLELRAFFRQFPEGEAPEEYYSYLRGDITREKLFQTFPDESTAAQKSTWQAELGGKEFPHDTVLKRIKNVMRSDCRRWVLIGGPPCQAYSLAGRSRMKHQDDFAKDERHYLYREYLRIIAEREPAVFVLENVQGILSSQADGKHIFDRILSDLHAPRVAMNMEDQHARDGVRYNIFPLNGNASDKHLDLFTGESWKAQDFVVHAERHGIPQARRRVLVLGVRADIKRRPGRLKTRETDAPTVEDLIADLPRLRSQISRGNDSPENWSHHLRSIVDQPWFCEQNVDAKVRQKLLSLVQRVWMTLSTGGNWIDDDVGSQYMQDWFHDSRLNGVCNHESRSHMRTDLWRYFFAATFAEVNGKSPLLADFPPALRPDHKNIDRALKGNELFSDRFRVQLKNRPATTIVAHISKDGHYYIHPDPLQCRSLTVREAARLQTFPDNYFFEGPHTEQYRQVGNAVPPLLAVKIAEIVFGLLA